jgi:hypothetical protein
MRRVTVYLDPSSPRFLRDRLFDPGELPYLGDQLLSPFAHLRDSLGAHNIDVRTADYLPATESRTDLGLYVSLSNLRNYRRIARRRDTVLSACFAMECPVVDPSLYRALGKAQHSFKRILSWSDSASLRPFVGGLLRCERFFWPQSFDRVHEETWAREDRGFLVMINSNKLPCLYRHELYTERLRALSYFAATGEIDLYGEGWDKAPLRLARAWVPWSFRRIEMAFLDAWDGIRPDPRLVAARRVYRGRVRSKRETLGRYKFALCFENMILKGWITEKIFDCFYAGTVPVYWGAPEISRYVPPQCFIDMRDFSSYGHLRDFLRSLTDGAIRDYKESARSYVASREFERFRKEAFAEHFFRIVAEDAGPGPGFPGARSDAAVDAALDETG